VPDDDLEIPAFLDRRVQRAIKDFRGAVTSDGGSATIIFGDKSVTISPPPPPSTVPAADGAVGTDHNQLPLAEPQGPSRNRPGGMNVGRLKGFIERVEKLEEERAAVGADIRDVYSEAKGVGYDVKTIRKLVQLRKLDAADRAEQESLLDTYKHALGMS